MAIKSKHFAAFLGSSALTRPLFVLGTASALLGSTAAQAFDANSLPQGGSVTGGSATIATSGKTLTVNQSSNRAVIDWRSFDIGSNAQANFNQPGTSSIAVNRVNGSVDPTRIEGGLHANGQVWVLNPNGVLFGKTARVDAAGVVATTANIDDKAFMAGSNRLQMTGGDHGQVVNEGHISVGQGGLAAFVAPSVRNSGTIRARVGKVALAAGDTYTLDLAGDRLVELGLGAGNAVVDQSGKVINAGGTITITAKAAGQVVDSVINMSGVVDASAVKTAGGQIILGGDEINVASNATLKADGVSGGQITAVANKTGNYAGSYSAQGTTGDGGQIETSGKTVHIDKAIAVSTKSAKGKTGNWTLDPDDLVVASGGAGSISGGVNDDANAAIDPNTVVTALNSTDVSLQAKHSIQVSNTIDASGNANAHNLALNDQDGGGLSIDLDAAIILKAGASLSGQATSVHLANGGLIQNADDVALANAAINIGPGSYAGGAILNKAGLTLTGTAGATINVDTSTVNALTLAANNITVSNLEIAGPAGNTSYDSFAWGGDITRGIVVNRNVTGFDIADNNIHGTRNDILVDGLGNTGSITGNTIANSKSGISVQYTDGAGIDISSNTDGGNANEWGMNLHLNGHSPDGITFFSNSQKIATDADSAAQSVIRNDSTSNGGWTIQDQGYTNSNRTAVTVSNAGLDTNQGSGLNSLASIGAGINAVISGGTVNVKDGTYAIAPGGSNYLDITKALTLKGQSEAGTIIDASNASTYGLRVEADNVSLSDFTLKGPTSAGGYGIKVEPLELVIAATDRVNNFSIANVAETGSYKNGLDLNGVASGTIDHVTVSGTTHGTGIALTDSANVTLTNNITTGNAWGGLALYQHNATYDQQVDGISVNASNTFNEANGVYMEDESASKDFGSVNIQGYDRAVKATVAPTDSYTWLQNGDTAAINFAVANAPNTASVQGWTGSAGNNIFTVGAGLKIQSAVDAASSGATINVNAGTFREQISITKNLTLSGAGAASTTIESPDVLVHSFTYDGTARKAVVSVEGVSNVAINNLTIDARGQAAANGAFLGLGLYNSGGTISDVSITGVRSGGVGGTLGGSQTTYGFGAFNDTGTNAVTLQNSAISDFEKDGAAFYGHGLTATVSNNTITGAGPTAVNAQNGIVLIGATGDISGNALSGIGYSPDTFWATAIYLNDSAGSTVSGNTVNGAGGLAGSTLGIYAANSAGAQITGNTFNGVEEGIDLATNATVTGNTFKNSANGIEIEASAAGFDISGNTFSNNLVQAYGSAADVATVQGANTFDRTVVNNAVGDTLYGDLQTAIDGEADHSTLTLAGTFGSGANVKKAGDILDGQNTAMIQALHNGDNGLTITANDVTIKNLEIAGPASDIGFAWGSDITRGIVVARNITGFNITGNNIHGTRNNILVDGLGNTGSITGNIIAASKSGISVQYTDGAGIDIEGNTDGNNVNEWGMNLHLNGHYDDDTSTIVGTKIATDADSSAQTQILNDSIFNNNWTVQDQGYSSSNRSAVTVATTGNDAAQGSSLNSLATIQAGINAVINGGTVNVKAGTYDQALDISKALTIAGAGAGQTIIQPTTLLDTGVGHKYDADVKTAVYVHGVSEVNISGVTIDSNNPGANATVFWNNAGGSIKDSEIANSAAPLGPQTGHGIAVDAGTDGVDPYQSSLTIDNVSFHDWSKNAIDAVTGNGVDGSNGGNISLTVKNSTFTGQGDTGLTAQNGILLWERGGGSVSATIDNSTFSDLGYTDPTIATAAGVLVYGVHNGAVSISNSHFNNVQEYVSTADSLNGVDATNGNTFDDVAADTATLDQLFAIEDHMNHGTEDATAGLVRVKAGQVYVTADKADIVDSVAAASAGDTVNVQDGSYTLAGELDIAKSLTLKGQSQAGTEITSNSTGYGVFVTGNDVSLSDFTYNAPTAIGSTYGIKVEPGTNTATDRVTGFNADHLTINGGYRTGLDLNGIDGATIDNVSVSGVVHGNGIALTDSANVTITNTDTSNNAWGGLALYQTNAFYDQQVDNISVDASNSFNDTIPVYAEDQSASKDFGSIALAGFDYVVKSPNDPADVYTWFQKTQQGAVNFATDSSLGNGNVNIPTATVQGYAGSGVGGDGHFTVGVGANGTAMSVNVALDQSSANDAIDVLHGTYAEDVSLIAPRTVTFDDATLNSLSVLSTGAGSTLAGSVKAGAVTASTIVLGGELSLDTSATNGTIAIALVDGAHDLTVNAGTGNVAFDRLGATTRLGAVDITAGITAVGGVNKAASFNFDGDVVVTHPTTLIDTTVSSTAAGNVTFGGDIYTLTDGGENLVISAGPGTGDKSANGDIVMKNAGVGFDSNHNLQRLGSLTVSGDDFSALTVNLKNDFKSTLTGNQVFAADTLNAGGNVNSQVGGNATGHIVAGGNVNMSAGGDVSGTISGQTVDLSAGDAISGNISGQTVSLTGQTVNGQVTANTLNVSAAQGGAITGTFTPGTVSNGLSLNGQVTGSNTGGSTGGNTGGTGGTQTGGNTGGSTGGNTGGTGSTQTGGNTGGSTGGNTGGTGGTQTGDNGGSTGGNTGGTGGTQTGDNGGSTGGNTGGSTGNNQAYVNGQQLVVENFVLPAGTQIGANGALILPQNVVIGLLSPGGGPARVIMVHDVGTLGALLAEGYVAIVIDLNKKKDEPVAVAAN